MVQIGLKRVDNGNNTYSVATFRKVEDLQPEQVGEFRAFVESFRQQAKEMLKNRAELSAAREGEEDQYATANTEYAVADSGQHFCISGADGQGWRCSIRCSGRSCWRPYSSSG